MTKPGVCILAAPGPSLPSARLGEYEALPDILAVTSAFSAVPRARHVYACDRRWWKVYRDDVGTAHPAADLWMGADGAAPVDGVTPLALDVKATGLSTTPGTLHAGRNSGYQAINLAALLGYTTLLLVGYDMRQVGGQPHFFGHYSDQTLRRDSPYDEWVPLFRTIEPSGFEVVNCTPDSAIDAFPFGALESFL